MQLFAQALVGELLARAQPATDDLFPQRQVDLLPERPLLDRLDDLGRDRRPIG
jgi:hypothetical protein